MMLIMIMSLILILFIFSYFINFKMNSYVFNMIETFECGFKKYLSVRISMSMPYFFFILMFLFLDLEIMMLMPFFLEEVFMKKNLYIMMFFIFYIIMIMNLEINFNLINWSM